jgi:hypothetical protein
MRFAYRGKFYTLQPLPWNPMDDLKPKGASEADVESSS